MGSWTLYHGPFSLSIRAAGWGKIAVGSSSGKAPSGCCDPRKTADFKAENSRVRHRFAGVRHGLAEATGWQRPRKPLFLPGTGWNTTEGKGSFHARATPQNRAQKKEFPLRNADHKKDSAPRSEKSRLFPLGFTRGVPRHCGESLSCARANCRKSPHHATVCEKNNRIPRGHYVAIVRGESQRITAIKKSCTTAMLARQSVGNCAHKKGEKRRV